MACRQLRTKNNRSIGRSLFRTGQGLANYIRIKISFLGIANTLGVPFVLHDVRKTEQNDRDDEKSSGGEESSDVLEGNYSPSEDSSMEICSPHRSPWEKVSDACLEQVNHYARDYTSRYCYLVFPIEFLVARPRMDEPMSPSISLATTRTPREVGMRETPSKPIRRLFGKPLSSSPPLLSSPYTYNGKPDTNMKPIQLCSITLDASGPDRLTFNLALWALHILAALDCEVRTEYPPIGEDPTNQN